jgi:cation diffusion facilitator family transporter
MATGSRKVVLVAGIGNGAIAIAKFATALLRGSSAMVAEGLHSVVDTGNELLLLLGLKRSERPPDSQHPFGHGKEIYFWGLIVAMSVFAIGGGMSGVEGIYRILHPKALENPWWSYGVLAFAAIFEGYSWNVARKGLKKRRREGESYWRLIRRSKHAATFTPFVEDTVALAGIAIAFLGIFLSHELGAPFLDPAASILIGLLLAAAAVFLAVEIGGLRIGETADPQRLGELKRIIRGEAAVERLGDLLTMQLGPEEILLNADVRFRRGLHVDDLELAVDRIEESVRSEYPEVKRIFFETEAFKERSEHPAA